MRTRWKLLVFLVIALLIVPFLVQWLAREKPAAPGLGVLPAIILLSFAFVFWTMARKAKSFPFDWRQGLLFGVLACVYFLLYVAIRYDKVLISLYYPGRYALVTIVLYSLGLLFLALAVFQIRFLTTYRRQLVLALMVTIPALVAALVLALFTSNFVQAQVASAAFLLSLVGISATAQGGALWLSSFTIQPYAGDLAWHLLAFGAVFLGATLLEKRLLLRQVSRGLAGLFAIFLIDVLRVFLAALVPSFGGVLISVLTGWALVALFTFAFLWW